jgi:hypothetical protein
MSARILVASRCKILCALPEPGESHMALIDCSECGHRVSDLAAACPSCGAPVRRPDVSASPLGINRPPKKGKGLRILVGLLVVLPLALGLLSALHGLFKESPKEAVALSFRERLANAKTPEERDWIEKRRQEIEAGKLKRQEMIQDGIAAEELKRKSREFSEDLIERARSEVLARLKAPATAKFPALVPDQDQYVVQGDRNLGDGAYFVSSWVDSQNSFGATIRSKWIVKFIKTGRRIVV